MSTTTKYNHAMTCESCARAATALLSKVPGVEKVETDVPSKTVTVTGTASPDTVIATLRKTGKETSLAS